MHLFFNDPRVAYVTRHRRIVRHPLVALVAGGVGVAALGVAIGSAGWEPPRHGGGAGPQHEQQGMVLPDPVREINLYDVPAAPQPVLGPSSSPPRVLAGPQAPRQAKAPARQIERAPQTTAPIRTTQPTTGPTEAPTAQPTVQPTTSAEPTPEPTAEPTAEPTEEPTEEPTVGQTVWGPGWHHHHGRGHWPWDRAVPAQ